MRVITPGLLVAAVTELSLSRSAKLVRLKDVVAWCEWNGVDCQGPGSRLQALWDADREEAQGEHRLLKFKSGECKQSRVGWALRPHGDRAREAAALLGWRELLWDGEKWEWLGGSPPVVTRRPHPRRERTGSGPETDDSAQGLPPG
ncbi:hypothetical protein [Myxococcus sp. Y35]|uniref:hypothetical protein n=1 Tax=Pseudomyxococcus flavus TaxID=3115648 RepID=UPI003CF2DEE2